MDKKNMMKEDEYRDLSNKEQAILKLPVFFDGYDNFYHPIRESVTNARDILLNNDDGIIEIILHDDNRTVTIKDNGYGIRLDGESNGRPNWKHAFLILFSGSKMSTGKTSGGTNGCGLTIINYSSDLMEITSKREGKIYHIKFKDGGEIEEPFKCLGNTNEHGTEITFKLCDKIYTDTVFNENEVKGIVERIVVTSPNITSIFKYKDKEYVYNFKTLSEYFNYKEIDRKINDILFNEKEYDTEFYNIDKKAQDIEHTKINLIVNLSEENKLQYPFLNGIYMPQLDANTVRSGIINGFKDCLHRFIKDNNLYEKKEKRITKQDIEDSISYICSIESTNVSYTSQTKFSTKKELYEELLKSYIKEFMDSYSIENKEDIMAFATQILINKRSREQSEINRKEIKNKLETKSKKKKPYIEKLSPCTSKNPEECEIHLFEGDSAGGNAKQARNRRFQATLPQRGKSKNTIKGGDNSIDSEVLKNIKDACGFEYGENYKENDLNYWKIILQADGDDDGANHIVPLWLTYFYTKVPKLIEDGHLYICIPPLYKNELKNKEEIYTYSEQEQLTFLKENKPSRIQRYKGLGEMSPQQLWDTTLNPETRRLIQVKIDDFEEADKTFELLMGKEVAPRKEFIVNFANERECNNE